MRILALNPYHGGSHKAFINSWIKHSRHEWTLLTLPAHHWKWRMRHAAITLTQQISRYPNQNWDIIFCTDMLNLAEFNGLATPATQKLPKILYCHESQLIYPDKHSTERDNHYSFTNFISALTADQIWFNSDWHKNIFITTTRKWLKNMPDYQPLSELNTIQHKSITQYPGLDIDCFSQHRHPQHDKPLTILWAARWEDDKNPELFFKAIDLLIQDGIHFQLNIIGAAPKLTPPLFLQAQQKYAAFINNWGYINNRDDYLSVLHESDLVVSTADHEFFGIAVLEAVSMGCIPILPDKLAYPETLSLFYQQAPHCFYDGNASSLANALKLFSQLIYQTDQFNHYRELTKTATSQYSWDKRSIEMDNALSQLVTKHCSDKK